MTPLWMLLTANLFTQPKRTPYLCLFYVKLHLFYPPPPPPEDITFMSIFFFACLLAELIMQIILHHWNS